MALRKLGGFGRYSIPFVLRKKVNDPGVFQFQRQAFSEERQGSTSTSTGDKPHFESFSFKEDNSGSGGPRTGDFSTDAESEDEFQTKLKILAASLNHVNTLGWTSEALKAGATDLNLSEAVGALCTPFDLVEYFQRSSNHKLENHIKTLDSKNKNLYSSVEYRLKLVTPYIDRYHQAMGLSLEPFNVPRSLKVLRELSDIICIHGLGDTSTDLRWYSKRTGISSLFVATECCMVQDKSDEFKETWEFLQRRVKNFEACEQVGAFALPLLETGAITLLNVLGMNRKR